MSCSTIAFANIQKNCKDNAGGIKKVYIIDYDKVESVATDDSTGAITGLTTFTGSTFSKWEFATQTGTFTSTATISEENGTLFFQNDAALVFGKAEKQKRLQMMAATVGNTAVVVLDSNNNLWYMGFDNPVNVSALVQNTGTSMGDKSGYDITLTDFSKELPRLIEMSSTDLESLGID